MLGMVLVPHSTPPHSACCAIGLHTLTHPVTLILSRPSLLRYLPACLASRCLEEAILNFAGSTLVISHDRYFLDRVATHILAFEGDSKVGGVRGGTCTGH